MNKAKLIDQLTHAPDEQKKIDAVHRLGPYMSDPSVLETLCSAAVETDNWELREALIETLGRNGQECCQCFVNYAMHSTNPLHRCRALFNLYLMECRSAKDAVLTGLRDPVRSVRVAAAFNAGLYKDPEVLDALQTYFSCKRFDFVLDILLPNPIRMLHKTQPHQPSRSPACRQKPGLCATPG